MSNQGLDMAFRRGGLRFGLLLQVLDEIGVSPEDFFFDCFDLRRHKPRPGVATDEGILEWRQLLKEERGNGG